MNEQKEKQYYYCVNMEHLDIIVPQLPQIYPIITLGYLCMSAYDATDIDHRFEVIFLPQKYVVKKLFVMFYFYFNPSTRKFTNYN